MRASDAPALARAVGVAAAGRALDARAALGTPLAGPGRAGAGLGPTPAAARLLRRQHLDGVARVHLGAAVVVVAVADAGAGAIGGRRRPGWIVCRSFALGVARQHLDELARGGAPQRHPLRAAEDGLGDREPREGGE